ncbi:rRNA maturation RNase YbeY [Pseudidiomarina sp.]|uniref:rRNA maturation RNase YbeY n=1 Tax=Pseudidiomarina sp. TaxID=2081707 RepID=UPI00299D39A8|nr:rRNA maturation RNase YbeY [Pseudidiomarina sp.]MDX1705087.1 rRNA maturation RNase YbeY [Pseudidiomarina sp.]
MSHVTIDLQLASTCAKPPAEADIELWVSAALRQIEEQEPCELTVRIVDETEALELNQSYRQRDYPTNVLSFPFEAPIELPVRLLGDLVICGPVIEREAAMQQKPLTAHWAHMIVHGTLHLLGYDHIDDDEAVVMERLEQQILEALGYADPYVDDYV